MKKLTLFTAFFLISVSLFSQQVCLYESFYIKIDHIDNVPTIENSQDNNTIILTHKEKYITDIFAKYVIYNFSKPFPSAESEVLQKVYSISSSSKGLLKELSDKVPSEIFWFEPNQVNLNIINFDEEVTKYFKNETLYKFEEFTSISESCTYNSDCLKITDLKQVLTIYYDENNDFLVLEGKENTTCFKPFKIKLKQVFNDAGKIRLIVWEIDSNENCFIDELSEICKVESAFFETIKGYPILELEKEGFTITGSTPIFTDNIFSFGQEALSIKKDNLQDYITISQNLKTDFLSVISNSNDIKIKEVIIFSILGKEVVFKENSLDNINVSFLKSGIYIIQIKTKAGFVLNKKILK